MPKTTTMTTTKEKKRDFHYEEMYDKTKGVGIEGERSASLDTGC